MTKKNEKSVDFHESLTLRRDRKRRVNRFNCSRLDLSRFCHFRESSQDQDKQNQNSDDHKK